MRRKARSGFRAFKRSVHRSSPKQAVLFQPDAMVYGAVRQYASNMLAPLTSMVPLGTLSDEVAMGFVDYMVAKHTSGFIADVAKKGLVIENARVGEAIVNGGLSVLTGTSSSQTNWN